METRPVDTFGSEGVDVAFIQTEQDMDRAPPAKAYKALKAAITATKSLRLVRLAASVRTATKGHFDDVISEIDTMLQTLKDEEAEDIKQRDWCIEERDTERNNRDDLLYDIKQLENKIDRAELKKKKLNEEKDATEEAKEDLLDDMAQAKADREEENANFIAAKEDDEKAIALLQDATAAMSTYGDNNLALLQKKRQPVFEVSEDQAPDATFSSADKHKGATDGVIALLKTITENLQNEVAVAIKAEAKATEEFLALAATDAEIEADTNTKTDTTGEKDATLEYLEKIKPNCDWIEGAFTKRAEARKKESEGLMNAKAILAGAEGGEFGFLQRVQ